MALLQPARFRAFGIDVERPRLALDDLGADHDLLDPIEAGQLEHRVEQNAFHDRAQAARAGAPLDRLLGDDVQRFVLEGQIGVLHLEQPLVLLDQRVLRLGQDLLQRLFVEILERRDDRQTADEFGDQTEFQQILGLNLAEDFAGAAVVGRLHLGARSRSTCPCRAPR